MSQITQRVLEHHKHFDGSCDNLKFLASGSKPRVGGIFSFFGPFLFHIICPLSLVLKFVQPLCVV